MNRALGTKTSRERKMMVNVRGPNLALWQLLGDSQLSVVMCRPLPSMVLCGIDLSAKASEDRSRGG